MRRADATGGRRGAGSGSTTVVNRPSAKQFLSRAVAGVYSRGARRYDAVVTRGTLRFGTPGGREALAAWAASTSPAGDAPVLDLPTGTGEYLAHLPAPVVGADLAEGMLRRAVSRAPDVPLVRADAFSLPFPDGSFGAVFSALGLQLMPRPRQAVAEMARVLRPGGVLQGAVPVVALPPFFTLGAVRRVLEVPDLEVEHLERRRFLAFFRARRRPHASSPGPR